MHVRFLLGPAGSGKTFRCLAEIRARLLEDPLGPPLILLAPRQATYQLELQLLSDPDLAGYTRLQIVSFERFASWLLEQLGEPPQDVLSEEGRIMVLRALLHQHHGELKTFGESSRSAGFARMLSEQLHEVQQHRVTPHGLRAAAEQRGDQESLADKLHDLAFLLEQYQAWLANQNLPDAGTLLDRAIGKLTSAARSAETELAIDGLWLDGAAELTPQEMDLLAALMSFCKEATLAFCLESEPKEDLPWLSTWSVISQTFRRCHARLNAVTDCQVEVDVLGRTGHPTRFGSVADSVEEKASSRHSGKPKSSQLDLFGSIADQTKTTLRDDDQQSDFQTASGVLGHLESAWTTNTVSTASRDEIARGLSLIRCAGPEQEAIMAAREIVEFVQAGNRFRECAILLRQLETHQASLRRVFTRYGIPFFMDRREPVAHHPLAELTRSALHTVQFHWRPADWFSALKSGLTCLDSRAVDRLETVALEHGWEGGKWFQPLMLNDDPALARECDGYRQKVLPPFERFRNAVTGDPTGNDLASAIRKLWEECDVETKLQDWVTESESGESPGGSTHLTVLEEMHGWLENLERAFGDFALPLREWLPILETGLNVLTVGVIPPAIDQVLIGAVDRSRNPDLKLAIVLGLNEGIFPQPVTGTNLLTESDRSHLEGSSLKLRGERRLLLGHERYLGYIAFTRARWRVVLSWSEHDAAGKVLNRSPLVDHVTRLFPNAEPVDFKWPVEVNGCVHTKELLAPLLEQDSEAINSSIAGLVDELPSVKSWLNRFAEFELSTRQSSLSAEAVQLLHGNRLKTSASRLEQFAACPFQYFVNASLRARERQRFEVDARKTGTFMHEVLRQFHEELESESMKWRSITPDAARERIARIAAEQQKIVADGVLAASQRNVFLTASMTALLQDFIAQVIDWMKTYQFDPIAVELSIGGQDGRLPWWEIDLGNERSLAFRGSVDRVDATTDPDGGDLCLNVLDYKSGHKKFEPLKMQAGLQVQLPAYLAALCAVAKGSELLGRRAVRPTGMFYVRLKDAGVRVTHRDAPKSYDLKKAFEHTGRFSFDFLSLFDSDYTAGSSGQFSYRLKKDGELHGGSKEPVSQNALERLIKDAEEILRVMGNQIMDGNIAVDPYRKGADLPCTWCAYKPVCRIDPWTHVYRPLTRMALS